MYAEIVSIISILVVLPSTLLYYVHTYHMARLKIKNGIRNETYTSVVEIDSN